MTIAAPKQKCPFEIYTKEGMDGINLLDRKINPARRGGSIKCVIINAKMMG